MTTLHDRELLSAIVASSDDAIIAKTLEGIVLSWNDGAERLYGYSAAEAIGRHISFLVPPDRSDELPRILACIARGERIEPYETTRRRKDGVIVAVSLSVAPVIVGGTITGAAAIARDIGSQIALVESLRRERERLATSERVAEIGSWAWSVADDVVSWSDEMYHIAGVDPAVFRPSLDGFLSCVHPADRGEMAATVRTALLERRGFRREYRLLHPDGSVRLVEGRGEVALDGDLSVGRMYGVLQDITERRIIADDLRRHQETLELRARATTDAVWDWDIAAGRVERNGGLQAYGYAAADVGEPAAWWNARIHPEDHDRVEQSLEAFFASAGSDWSAAYRFRRADGSYASVLDRGHLVRDPAGAPRRMVGSMQDVTERERNQDDARRSAASAELLSRASHELRTPLNAILGFSDLLEQRLEAMLGPRERRYLQNIRRSGEHLLELIDRLLQLSKADSGAIRLERTIVGLAALVESAAATVGQQAAAAEVGLSVAPVPDASVRVDREHLTSVLRELLTNAIAATPPGGSVRISAGIPEGDLLIEVADTGRGIPEAARDRVFGVFENIHEEATGSGTGLGLALCRDLIELHGGTITFESRPGTGTTFRVCIPHAAWRRSDGERVLIVEDDPYDADLAMTVCSDAGLRCEVVGTVAEALSCIQRELPHAAVVDLHLPDGSGETILSALHAADADLPVLVLSADPDATALARGGQRLMKPVDIAQLRDWLLAATAKEVPA